MDSGPFKATARPSAPKGAEAANRYAITSLVLGIASIVLLLAFATGLWAYETELDAWVVMVLFTSLVAAIYASRFGVKGRRLAKVGTPERVQATVGLVLGMGSIAVLVVGVIIGVIAISIITSNDFL